MKIKRLIPTIAYYSLIILVCLVSVISSGTSSIIPTITTKAALKPEEATSAVTKETTAPATTTCPASTVPSSIPETTTPPITTFPQITTQPTAKTEEPTKTAIPRYDTQTYNTNTVSNNNYENSYQNSVQEQPSAPRITTYYGNYCSDAVGYLSYDSIRLYNIPIVLGVDQYTIDTNEIGMYHRAIVLFSQYSTVLFGHNYKSMGNIKYAQIGDTVTIESEGSTYTYQVYYKGVCIKSDDLTYMVDNQTGEYIYPFHDTETTDLYLITCHDTLHNADYVVKARMI